MQFIYAIRHYLLLDTIQTCTCNYCFQAAVELVGQLPAFGQKFKTYIGNGCAFKFTIYKYVIHIILWCD